MTALDSDVGSVASASRIRLPALMFFVAILAVTLAHWPLLNISRVPIQWVDAAVVLVYLALLLECIQTRKLPQIDALLLPILVFMGALAVSCLGSPHPLRSALKLLGFAPYLALPVLGGAILQTRDDLRLVVRGWWLSLSFALAVCILTLFVFYWDRHSAEKYLMCGYGGWPTLPVPRLCAPFANMNALFNHFLSGLCIFAVTGYARLGTRNTVIAYGLVAFIAAFTGSAGLAALAVSTALLLGWAVGDRPGPLRTIRWVAAVGAAVAVVLVTLSMAGGLVRGGSGDINVGSVGYSFGEAARPPVWRAAARNFAEHPVFGLGYGEAPGRTNDPRAWRVHDDWGLPHDGSYHNMDAHNAWLNVAGQAGIFGLLAFAWLVGTIWVRALRARKQPNSGGLSLSHGLAAALLGWFVHSFFGSFEEARELWLLFAMVIAVSRQPAVVQASLQRADRSLSA